MNKTSLSPRKKPLQSRSKEKVRKILEATTCLLGESGVEGVSAINVAERAGINVASFYQYFPNRSAVIHAVFEGWTDWVMTRFDHMEKTHYLSSPWPLFFSQLGDEIFRGSYINEKAAMELLRAMEIFPKLKEMNEKHGDKVAGRLAGYMRGYGAQWTDDDLKDLALCIFYSSNGMFCNAVEQTSRRKELFMAWGTDMLMVLLERCLERPD